MTQCDDEVPRMPRFRGILPRGASTSNADGSRDLTSQKRCIDCIVCVHPDVPSSSCFQTTNAKF